MDRKPRILRVTTVALSLRTLLKGQMKFMKENGFEVLMTSAADDQIKSLEEDEGVKHVSIPLTRTITPFQDLKTIKEMRSLIKSFNPDIVHTHTPKAGLIGMLAAKVTGVPIRMHTVAGMPLMEKSGIIKKILLAVEKLTYAAATKVYPNSNTLAEYIVRNNLTNKNKLHVIGNGSSNGIDTSHFSKNDKIEKEAELLRSKYELGGNFIYGFIGRIVGDKGINELVKAFEKINASNPSTRLLLVGPFESELDPLQPETESLIKNHPNIINTGFQKDIRPYLELMDVFVFPSYREGFPNVVMQAGCFDLPCIVSDINGCNEIIIEGRNGTIIPPKDIESLERAMIDVLNNQEFLEGMASQARELITSRYDQKVVWEKILEEYDKNLKEIGVTRAYRESSTISNS
ncbi:glycosyltransferase family 4 protein [Marinigracilibium pacificum]|uniref:Glycosyltransferase family 4 protein n=1 Tax=Marinigracilibium pacificum TaxID=2729599 RepID=A0A848IXM3_9BACT|nr:glycosyltransferase family 4 protein [Marinigracilibium pacificum]NMM48035.1 glycosyltransferase family 4 protein [Marinigracilibium pacificum]